jgi:hypothetical protein
MTSRKSAGALQDLVDKNEHFQKKINAAMKALGVKKKLSVNYCLMLLNIVGGN